jgi:hypothetical protein
VTLFGFPESDEFVTDVLGCGRWELTGQSGAPPDSPVIFSEVAQTIPESNQFTVGPAWGTEHCPVHQAGAGFGWLSQLFSYCFLLFLSLFLALR